MKVGDFNLPNATGVRRFWCWAACPRCASVISLEAHPDPAYEKVLSVIPDRRQDVDVDHLPADVAKYYGNALTVRAAGVPSAAAVELRRTLEAAASHKGVSERTLVKSVAKLVELGFVTKDFGDVLGHSRQVGNQGAHATDVELTEEDVDRALKFTTQVLRNLFEVPAELALLGAAPAAVETDPHD